MSAPIVLEVNDVSVTYRARRARFRSGLAVKAAQAVSFEIRQGETLSLVGESGSGKSTVAKAILRLVPPDSGSIRLLGEDITTLRGRPLRMARRNMQAVFQDPYSSLDPSATIEEIIGEPLKVHEKLGGSDLKARAAELLELVGLRANVIRRYPHEFSGGQRQRIAIARALALRPALLICDEPVSALDVSTQNQIMNLLRDLQQELGLSYLVIAHDLSLVRSISTRVAVMYAGRLVEVGDTEDVFSRFAHPYTEALINSIPGRRRRQSKTPPAATQRDEAVLAVESAELGKVALTGCAFEPRCPYALVSCRTVQPPLTPLDSGGVVACLLQTEGPELSGRPLHEINTVAR